MAPLTAADIPAWVPRLVADIALRIPPNPIVRRLVTDDRMKAVWRLLPQQHADDAWADLRLLWVEGDIPLNLTRDAISAYSAPERAAAALFVGAIEILSSTSPLLTRAEYDAQAKRFADAAALCLEQRQHSHGSLQEALDIVAVHFAHKAKIMETVSGPQVVERSSSKEDRGADALRVQTRQLAAASLTLYGRRNCGTLATIVSVATGADVTKPAVIKMTADLAPDRQESR